MPRRERKIQRGIAEKVINNADILLVIGLRLPISRVGENYAGLCPFCFKGHLGISEEKRFFYCFGCKKSGTALTFLMDLEGITFLDALKYLASMDGIDLY